MSYVTFDGYVLSAFLAILMIASIYFSGLIAQRRGRSFGKWAWIAGILIGPLAIPLLYLLPNLHDNSERHA